MTKSKFSYVGNLPGLEGPAGADVPLPVFSEVAAGAAFYIQIDVAVVAGFEGGADAVFKPGVVEGIADFEAVSTVVHRYVIAAAKFMQQVGFGVDDALSAYLTADVEADAANGTFDAALVNVDAVAGAIIVTAQIAQGELSLRLEIPAVFQRVFTAVFGAQRDAGVVKVAGDLVASGIVGGKVIVHSTDLEDHVQIMAFAADLGIIEADGFAAVVAAAAGIAAVAVGVAEGYALVTGLVCCLFGHSVVAQLVGGVFVFKIKAAVAADLGAADTEPDALGIFAIQAQFAHALQQFVVFVAPGMVVERVGAHYCLDAGSRHIDLDDLFQVPVFSVAAAEVSGVLLIQFIAVPVQGAFAIDSCKAAVVVVDCCQHCADAFCSDRGVAVDIVQVDVLGAGEGISYIQLVAVVSAQAGVDVHFDDAVIAAEVFDHQSGKFAVVLRHVDGRMVVDQMVEIGMVSYFPDRVLCQAEVGSGAVICFDLAVHIGGRVHGKIDLTAKDIEDIADDIIFAGVAGDLAAIIKIKGIAVFVVAAGVCQDGCAVEYGFRARVFDEDAHSPFAAAVGAGIDGQAAAEFYFTG